MVRTLKLEENEKAAVATIIDMLNDAIKKGYDIEMSDIMGLYVSCDDCIEFLESLYNNFA